jgi:hypothetical protein
VDQVAELVFEGLFVLSQDAFGDVGPDCLVEHPSEKIVKHDLSMHVSSFSREENMGWRIDIT